MLDAQEAACPALTCRRALSMAAVSLREVAGIGWPGTTLPRADGVEACCLTVTRRGAEVSKAWTTLNPSPACAQSHRRSSLQPMNSKQLKERAKHLEAQGVQLAAEGEIAEAVIKMVQAEHTRELAKAVARAEKRKPKKPR
jgi:hypothetical protein